MAFTALDVKNLREQTGCGMMDCKKALTEAEGNIDKAIEILRERGLAQASKKAGRVAAEGMVYSFVDNKNNCGVALEVNAETDFVAKNEMFQMFVKEVAAVIAAEKPASVEALLELKMADGTTVEASRQDKVLVIGENIQIRRFEIFEGDCVAYIHGGGSHAVLVSFDTDVAGKAEFELCGKDVAMQIAAVNPTFLNSSEVSSDAIEEEKKILMAQIEADEKTASKPEQVKTKMIEGKIGKYYKENCLLDQPFVKDDKISVGTYVSNTAKELGGKIEILKFVRFEKGEGIEKTVGNFAEEIASMVK